MPAMTYNSLITQIASYLNRSDVDTIAQIPNFIYQAQQRLCREVKNIGLETYATGLFTPGVWEYAKPANWRESVTFNCGTGPTNNSRSPIELRSYEYIISYWPDRTVTGTPLYYSDYGYNNYIIAPTPVMAFPFEFAFLGLPTPITALNQMNWFTNFAPDVLLYACLVETSPYLKDDEHTAMWNNEYQTRVASLNGQDAHRVTDRQSNRTQD